MAQILGEREEKRVGDEERVLIEAQISEHIAGGANKRDRICDVLADERRTGVARCCLENGIIVADVHAANETRAADEAARNVAYDVAYKTQQIAFRLKAHILSCFFLLP